MQVYLGMIWCDYLGRIACKGSQCNVGLPEPLTVVSFKAIRMTVGFGDLTDNVGWKTISFTVTQVRMFHCLYCIIP